jgi:hypothetical protein
MNSQKGNERGRVNIEKVQMPKNSTNVQRLRDQKPRYWMIKCSSS